MRESNSRSGDYGKVVTPVPIPNTEVKHFSGNDSYACHSENSTSPGYEAPQKGAFFIYKDRLRGKRGEKQDKKLIKKAQAEDKKGGRKIN